jgi:hypothetical protein
MAAGVLVLCAPLALLIATFAYNARTGCGSIDPTDPANYSRITILNDQSASIVVDDCEGGDCTLSHPVRLAPGQGYADNAACGMSDARMTSWQIRSSNETPLGYIAVDTPRKNDGLVFRVSNASRDRRTATPAG